jgi:hypothetical protein
MFSRLVRALAVFLLASATAEAQGQLDRGLPINSDASIRIYNTSGSVRVTGWARDSIAVRGNLGEGNVLHFGGNRNGVKMFVEGRDERNPAPAAIEVMVPFKAKVWVKTSGADVDATGLTGSLDMYVIGGRITVTGNPTDLNAEAIDGVIKVTGSPGWIRAKSASGDVTFIGQSSDVTLSTVSGKIEAGGAAFEKAKFETVTGDIRFAGSFRPGGLVNFDTHSGTIEVGLTQGSPADFDIVSMSGAISNKLTSTKPMKGRYGRGAELGTSAGGGGTRVVVRSFKGPISLLSIAKERRAGQ